MWRFFENVTEPQPKKAKTKEDQLQTQRMYEKEKRKRCFQDSWKKEFEWLRCEDECIGMTCSICTEYESNGSFVTGCLNFKIQTIKKHASSESHIRNAGKLNARSSSSLPSEGERSISMLNAAAKYKLRILFSNAHYVAKLGRPFTDYVNLCKLDKSNKDLDIGNTYLTDKYMYCQIFVRAIADTLREKQVKHYQDSPFISIISDGSTDCSSIEAECIMLSVSSANGKVLTQFIGLRHVTKADSQHITTAIVDVLNKRFGMSWTEKLVAVGCDGASVMLGEINGVVQKLRQHTIKPYVFSIHCSAHRYSPLNRSNLKSSFDSFGMKMVVPKRVGGTRWLPHTERAIKNLLYGKRAIIEHLEQIQNPSDAAHRKDSAAKAQNFLKCLRDKEVTVWQYFLSDVVSCLSKISEVIQGRNCTLADVYNELESAIAILTRYQDSEGPYLRKIESSGILESSRKTFLQSIIDALDNLFAGDLHLFKGSSFVSFLNWPEPVDGNSKRSIIHSLTWKSLWSTMSQKYTNLFCLVSLILSLPSSSVDAERGFSRMKFQKTDWRSRLNGSNLSDLMLISMEGPEVGEFDPDQAISHWESEGVRTRRPFYNDNQRQKMQEQPIEINIEPDESHEIEQVEQLIEQCTESSDEEDEESYNRHDLILLQQKSYRLLLSLM